MRITVPKKYHTEIRLMTKLATPIIIGQLGVILMGVIDNIMIGRLIDKDALAAASIGNALCYLIGSIAFGGIPVLAPLFAKNIKTDRSQLFYKYFSVIFYISILLTGVSLLIIFYFDLLQQPKEITPSAKSYFWLITLSNIPMFFFLLSKQVLDSSYQAKIAMYITFVGLIGNAVFNYVLITGVGLFQGLGLNGAGWATILNRLLTLVLILPFLSKHINLRYIKISWMTEDVRAGIKFVSYAGIQVFFEIGAFAMAVIMMGWISRTALAAHQIAINVAAIAYMMATGIAYASGIRIGDWLRDHNFERAKIAGHVSFLLVTIMMVLTLSIMLIFNTQIVSLYIDNNEVIELAASLLIIAALFQFSDGIQAVALGNLRGLEDVKVPALLTFIAYWIISLPCGYYLCFHMFLGPIGIWLGLLIGLSIAAVLLVNRFYKQINRNQREYLSM